MTPARLFLLTFFLTIITLLTAQFYWRDYTSQHKPLRYVLVVYFTATVHSGLHYLG
jgi:hypothetical protein